MSPSISSSSGYSYLQTAGGRYSGLASGIDTESIMEKLMQAESAQKEKLQQKYQTYEWKRDSYRSFYSKLSDLRDELYDDYALTSDWSIKTASSTNSSVASVQANASANGNLSISSIQSLASSAQPAIGTVTALTSDINASLSTKIGDINQFSSLFSDGATSKEFSITDGAGNKFDFSLNKTDTLQTAISKIKGSKVTLATGVTSAALNVSFTNGELRIDSSVKNLKGFDSTDKKSVTFASFLNSVLKDSDGNALSGSTNLKDISSLSSLFKDEDGNELASVDVKITDGTGADVGTITLEATTTIDDLASKLPPDFVVSYDDTTGALTSVSTKGQVSDSVGFISSVASGQILQTPSSNINGKNTLSDLGISGSDNSVTLRVLQKDGTMKDTTINYSSSDTIDSFISKLNSAGAGVSAIYSNGQLSLAVNATGASDDGGAAVKVVSGTTDGVGEYVFSRFGLDGTDLVASGSDAVYTVNGITMTSKSNTFTLNGYTVTLEDTLNATDNSGAPIGTQGAEIKVTSTTDTDAMIEKIKAFVKSYNELISSIRTSTSEKKYYDYAPLTDAQKSEMTEKEIEAWEAKSKSGILRNDSYLSNVTSNLRSAMYGEVGADSTYKYLFQIGISTSSSYTDGGKLVVDEEKLREAIENNSEAVMGMFTDTESGIIKQTRDVLKTGMDSIKSVAGTTSSVETTYTLGNQMKNLQSKIDDWKLRLEDIEQRYWEQFTAMETAISKANSVTSMFA
ncbi:flagellar filament capping protein FliD [Bacillaceae bacterium CLA-AA-H227]|uniref:Flagellar filament capping protein FliD n=1 Tax=Robertmurraya yapensis (ex Hitch et al 2024) TaxID=3133160 RepID=A0ACC6SBW7_9BACI